MYAHEVIADYKYYDSLFKVCDLWKNIPAKINKAIKFHIGNTGYIESLMPIGKPLFQGEAGGVKLPFDLCWFDWNRYGLESKAERSPDGRGESHKRGVLCQSLFENVFIFHAFNYLENEKYWQPSAVAGIIFIDSKIDSHPQKNEICDLIEKSLFIPRHSIPSNAAIIPVPISPFIASELICRYHDENRDELSNLNIILQLLSCKNVATEKVHPSEKLNKKRKKSGKLPLFSYHTLVLKPTTQQEKSAPKHLWDNRIHLCRGHFKIYTEANKLFGKHTGRYWWQPCARGNKNKGIVMKDYLIAQERNPKCIKNSSMFVINSI